MEETNITTQQQTLLDKYYTLTNIHSLPYDMHFEIVRKMPKYGDRINYIKSLGKEMYTRFRDSGEIKKWRLGYISESYLGDSTPLIDAILDNNFELVNNIIGHAPNTVLLPDSKGFTPLIAATLMSGLHKPIFDMILSLTYNNINDKTKFEQYTALILAAKYSSIIPIKTIIKLLENGADINLPNMYGNTPLMVAVINSNKTSTLDAIDILLQFGANPNIQNINTFSPLMLAAKYSKSYPKNLALKLLIKYGANLDLQDKSQQTALMYAAMNTNTDASEEAVQILVNAGANVNIKNNEEMTALMLAAKETKRNSTEKTVEILINTPITVQNPYGIILDAQDKDGNTALMLAVKSRYSTLNTISLLVENGANSFITNKNGETVLSNSILGLSLYKKELVKKIILGQNFF